MVNKKPNCKYGNKCYRKNEKHFIDYEHSSGSSFDKIKKEGMKNKNENKRNPEFKMQTLDRSKRKKGCESKDNTRETKKTKTAEDVETVRDIEESSSDESGDEKSHSWTYIKASAEDENSSGENLLKTASKEEIINHYFLVDMPNDFYSFYEFCKNLNKSEPLTVIREFGLELVGPYDILSGQEISVDKSLMLCHWRYYYDPPEFQTVLASDDGFHIGYWRDDPKEMPKLMASNNPTEDCLFKIEGENIFGAVYNYLSQYIKKCDPFSKTKASKFQTKVSEWAEENKYPLEKSTSGIKSRQKKVNSKTFHGIGIVVPVDKKTEVGYRPLIETDVKLKKLCKQITEADDEKEREILMEKLQPLITFANIANDECDFGNSLELGIDLFCTGSPIFHNAVEHLLTTSYSLLNRSEYGQIIRAHLKNRKKDKNLSVI